ncbi:hypothetical protein ES332_A11G336600v1 [Gossypium tomentosum]|uniref:Thaumatin-like protein n=1 Tax=Gossypium tomentosum TaxID=34277 RepID=A0A5D2NI93_GOSTO|nr:hypothetical protein ES332_A11G336600v1 [Gossypium tomentosum]
MRSLESKIGRGRCHTGDCGGLLQCQAYGAAPNTLAEFSLNQFNNLDFMDISLIEGFNVPMEFSPTSGGCSKGIRCTTDIIRQCPKELKALGGCNNPCTVYKTDQYCCNSRNCGPTDLSRFFKEKCPDAYYRNHPFHLKNFRFNEKRTRIDFLKSRNMESPPVILSWCDRIT